MHVIHDMLTFPVMYVGTVSFATIFTKENGVRKTPGMLHFGGRLMYLLFLALFIGGVLQHNTTGYSHLLTMYFYYGRYMHLFKAAVEIMNGSFWRRTKFSIMNDATFPLLNGVLATDTLLLGASVDLAVSALMKLSEGREEPPETFQGKLSISSILWIKYINSFCDVALRVYKTKGGTTLQQWLMFVYTGCVMILGVYEMQFKSERRSATPLNSKAAVVSNDATSAPDAKLYLNIRGTTYDVTGFVKRHPGGRIIRQYVGLSRDATDAFATFHSASTRAQKILKTLPTLDPPKPTDPHQDTHLEVLHKKWADEGYFKPTWREPAWALCVLAMTLSGFAVASTGWTITGALLTGFAWAHCGFVQHHFGHIGGTRNRAVDVMVQTVFEGLLKGGSARWWTRRHTAGHHAMPNNVEHDDDLRTTPFFAWDPVLIKKVPTGLLRIQHLLFVPMLSLYVPLFFVSINKYRVRNNYWDETGVALVHYYFASMCFATGWEFLTFFWIGYAVQGVYLGLFFSLSHFAMPRVDDLATNWIEWQVITSCEWGLNSRFWDLMSGFLNLQATHHIVPQMPPFYYTDIRPEIEDFCTKHSIKYTKKSPYEALYDTLHGLYQTGFDEYDRRMALKARVKTD